MKEFSHEEKKRGGGGGTITKQSNAPPPKNNSHFLCLLRLPKFSFARSRYNCLGGLLSHVGTWPRKKKRTDEKESESGSPARAYSSKKKRQSCFSLSIGQFLSASFSRTPLCSAQASVETAAMKVKIVSPSCVSFPPLPLRGRGREGGGC